MSDFITATDLKSALHDGNEIALLDVREHGQYGESHLFYATSLPYSRLERDELWKSVWKRHEEWKRERGGIE